MLSTAVSASVSLEHSPINCSGRLTCFLNTEFTLFHPCQSCLPAKKLFCDKYYATCNYMDILVNHTSLWVTIKIHLSSIHPLWQCRSHRASIAIVQCYCCNRYWCWVSSSCYKGLCSRNFVQQYWGMHTKSTAPLPLKLTELASNIFPHKSFDDATWLHTRWPELQDLSPQCFYVFQK